MPRADGSLRLGSGAGLSVSEDSAMRAGGVLGALACRNLGCSIERVAVVASNVLRRFLIPSRRACRAVASAANWARVLVMGVRRRRRPTDLPAVVSGIRLKMLFVLLKDNRVFLQVWGWVERTSS